MKRRDLIRHLEEHGCQLLREGGNHTIYVNRAAKKTSSVPRHNELNNDLARRSAKIFKCRNQTSNACRFGGRSTSDQQPVTLVPFQVIVLRSVISGSPTDKVQTMLCAIPGPSALAPAHYFVGFDAVTSDCKEHRSHRDNWWRSRGGGAAASTMDHGRQDATLGAELLKMSLELTSQRHDRLP